MAQTMSETLTALKGTKMLQAEHFRTAATLALLTQKHMLMVGPIGQAKTTCAEELFNALDIEPERTHVIGGYKGAGEEILVNYLDPAKMERSEYDFLPGKSLLNVTLAFVDEVGAMSRVAQQALLQIMQSRRFSRAGIDRALPIHTVIAGGNTAPEDPAVRDRFAFQIPFELPREAYAELAGWAIESSSKRQEARSISWSNVVRLSSKVAKVPLTQGAREFAAELAVRYNMSPRRLVEALIPASKAWAVMEDDGTASTVHVEKAAPYVVMHTGELTMKRFRELQAEMQAESRKAAKASALKEWSKKVKALAERVDLARAQLHQPNLEEGVKDHVKVMHHLTMIRECREVIASMPNPDGIEDKALASRVNEMRNYATESLRSLARDLNLT